MVVLPHEQPEFMPKSRSLYIRKLSRFSFEAVGDLREAFLEMYSESTRREMGQRALFLYSEPRVEMFRPSSIEQSASEHFDSILHKRLGAISASKQYETAKWIEAVRNEDQTMTGFRLNVLLDVSTQEQLLASMKEELSQIVFGRKAIVATLWVPDTAILPRPNQRKEASHAIKQVVWGNDDPDSAPSVLNAPAEGVGAKVANIKWKSRIINRPRNEVA